MRLFNALLKLANNLKTTNMYQVIIHESGSQAKVFDFPTLELANQSVHRHADEMSLTYNEDQDGFGYAYDLEVPATSPFRSEIYIFEIA
jgi:hypothetical protein